MQGSRRRPSRSGPKFTCPSCRAAVRETRPNATVTTLLDIILATNPDRAKSAQEKEEIAQRYKPGTSVFPRVERTDSSSDDEEDQRVVQEVRQLSLQDNQSRTRDTRHRTPQSRTRRSDRSDHDTRSSDGRSDGRSRRRRDDERSTRRHGHHERGPRRTGDTTEETRRIEHQSSLRSLLSLSDAETMEEEILRQIVEEGLLDNIDMDNLGPRQEEELSERIAEAYRQRHRLRSGSGQQRSGSRQPPEVREPPESSTPNRPRARSHSAQRSATRPPRESSRPPASRPHLLDPLVPRPGPSTTQRRRSSEGGNRRRESPGTSHPAASSETTLRSTARSSSDSTDRPRASQAASRTTESSHTRRRRATESDQTTPRLWTPGSRERGSHHVTGRPVADSPTSVSSPLSTSQSAIPPISSSLVSNINGSSNQSGRPGLSSRPSSSRSNATHAPSFVEPSISCSRCGKANIQYELHKDCLQCNDGDYHLCFRCYRTGQGCLQWPGFAATAQANYGRILASSNDEPIPAQTPHVLLSSKYNRPSGSARRTANDDRQMTNDDPARRLQTGFFCDICKSPANESFWKCDQCNEGDWGFCNRCVNQGRCCTHPLLPICRLPSSIVTDTSASNSQAAASTSNADPSDSETFKILSFSTNCDICTQPISTSTTRFHCLVCNEGDYDVCSNCYLKLGVTGKISKENGHNGWRRCAKGHRMIVVGYEDHDDGQRRVVVRDLVGGRALKDEHVYRPSPQTSSANENNTLISPEVGTGDWSWKEGSERRKKASRFRPMPHALSINTNNPTHSRAASTTATAADSASPTTPTQSNPGTPTSATRRFPPDGGVGAIVCALWAWYPEDGVDDELTFPRGAEITEGENINDDWFWGCYAGSTGLFPGSHVRVVDEIS